MNESGATTAPLPTNLPVMVGESVRAADGTIHAIATVSVVMTFNDGTERTVVLQKRSGARWWAPADGINAS